MLCWHCCPAGLHLFKSCCAARVGSDLETQLEAMIDEMDAEDDAGCNKIKAGEAFAETTDDEKAMELRKLKEAEARVTSPLLL